MDQSSTLGRASAALARVEGTVVVLACAAIMAIMLIVVTDVAMRYGANRPLGWSYDAIGTYLMVCAFFLALSDTLHHHGHIAIDIFTRAIPPRLHHVALAVGYAVSTLLMAMVTWQGWIRLDSAWTARDLISTTVPWPTWPAYLMLVAGAGLMTLRCALRTVGHAASFVTGRQMVEMPPPPESAPLEGEHGE